MANRKANDKFSQVKSPEGFWNICRREHKWPMRATLRKKAW